VGQATRRPTDSQQGFCKDRWVFALLDPPYRKDQPRQEKNLDHLNLTLPTLEANLALDEALLLEAEDGGTEILRFWEWPHFAVVLGAGGKLADDVGEETCRADLIPLARRSTGGGTVLLGPGCLLFSLVLSYDRAAPLGDIRASYRWILEHVARFLTPLGVALDLAGTSDLVLDGRKVSGNSQQRKRSHLLHHGTLLYQFDIAQVSRYLKMPARQPEYRRQRPHDVFLANLPASSQDLQQLLREGWQAPHYRQTWPEELVDRLAKTKYAQDAWLRRR
jgi:lipoate-protein ligase A